MKKLDISLFTDLDDILWKVESYGDKHLMDYFLETPVFNKLNNSDKYIVVGRKGTGKTALRMAFKDKKIIKGEAEELEFQDIFTTSFFDSLISNPAENRKTNRDFIKFTILIQWMFLIIKDDEIPKEDRIIVEKILDDNGYKNLEILTYELLETKTIKTTREFNIKIRNFGFSNKTETEKDKQESEFDYIKLLPYLEKYIFSLLVKNKEYFILIDTLDKLRTEYKDFPEMYIKIISNLVIGVADLNKKLMTIKGDLSRTIIFIRNDMLDRIEGESGDMGKIIEDCVLKINWQSLYENEDEGLLNQMINKRLESGLKMLGYNPDEFEKPLIKNVLKNSKIMQSYIMAPPSYCRAINGTIDIKKFLHNKTLLRPRDYVAFFKHLSNSDSIALFEREYSEYYKKQTLDELKPIVGENYEIIKDAIQETCRNSSGRFRGNDFKEYFAKIKIKKNSFRGKTTGNLENEQDYEKFIIEAKDILKLLYEYSVIGYTDYMKDKFGNQICDKQGKPRCKDRFYYREEDSRNFFDSEIILHSGLYKAFGLV